MFKIDLRSDTVTQPSQAMRKAMAEAEVGDDVFGDDPTIIRLQETAAALLNKEAALFVPSGTMANQICLQSLTRPGDEIICDKNAHVFRNEGGAAALLSGLSIYPLKGERGLIRPEMIEPAIQPDNIHFPRTRVVALENTHNFGNGAVYPLKTINEVAELCGRYQLKMHLDGARLFNACAAAGYSPAEMVKPFDTVSFCLSKGLGAPVGSMVVSNKETISRALRVRKRLGGGMRQAGILAAAAIYALEHNVKRLAEDHARAKTLAFGLAELKGAGINPDHVETNIVIFDVAPSGKTPGQVISEMAELGVGLVPFGGTLVRAVTHLHISDTDVENALACFKQILG